MLFHDFNGLADDILDTATPTAMYVGNHPSGGLIKEHRLTIGDLNDEILPVKVCHQGIRDNGPTGSGVISLFTITAQHRNLATVDLPDENKSARCHDVGDDTPVCRYIFPGIADTIAYI